MDKGVWRTVGGRRIFIKDGEDLSTAMKESGKFNTTKKKEWNPDDNKEKYDDDYIEDAINEFGTTEDFREVGYIVTTGELLDFSGKKDGGPSGSRSMDHREISKIMDDGIEGS